MEQKSVNKVFIVIVTYNAMKWLPESLQSTKPYPVIVVDNNSQDETVSFIRSNHPEVVLLEQKENLGFGKANNIGIAYALEQEADFVFLLNQDAFLKPGTIAELTNVSFRNPEFGILSPIHLNASGNGLERIFSYYLKSTCTENLLPDLLLDRSVRDIYSFKMINAAAWLLPRKTLDMVGGFHPMFFLYGEDDNYCQRVLYHGLKIGICPKAFIRHDSSDKYHEKQKKGSPDYYKKFLNRIRVQYADVNKRSNRELGALKTRYLIDAVKSILKLNFEEMKIYLHKRKLIQNINFSRDQIEGRQKKRNYLEM